MVWTRYIKETIPIVLEDANGHLRWTHIILECVFISMIDHDRKHLYFQFLAKGFEILSKLASFLMEVKGRMISLAIKQKL